MTRDSHPEPQISEITRRNIFDLILIEKIDWAGRLNEPDFLSRLYNLKEMSSTDHRYGDAYGDIWQHRVRNWDWQRDWVFTDSRFDLLHCADEEFLRFLCEMIHPVVQADQEIATRLLDIFNEWLINDGFQIVETTRISGRPIYSGHKSVAELPSLNAARELSQGMTADHLNKQITRMEAAIHADPELAIGTVKELIETCCKTILREKESECDERWEVPKLVHATFEELDLGLDQFPRGNEASESIRRTLGNLAQVAQGASELRNIFGTGHGKDAASPRPEPHHARLAVGAASTIAVFLFETHRLKSE